MITLLGISAGLMHALAAAACILAYRKASARRRFAAFWMVLIIFFMCLAGFEALNLPQHLRIALKLMAKASGHYDERRGFQAEGLQAVAVVAACLALLGGYMARRKLRKEHGGGYVAIAAAGALGHVLLMAVRIVSFHAIDQIFIVTRANWIMFAGLTGLSVFAALRFAMRRPRRLDAAWLRTTPR